MTEISYANAPVPVREDLLAAHRRAWQRLARSGTWWTGAERVAIAAEARRAWDCSLCRRRKAALSPYTTDGRHDGGDDLPDAAVDAVHRIVTDPGRLAKGWFDKLVAAGVSDAHYVELLSVIGTVVSIDAFCRGLGVPLHPLPEPEPGEPSRNRPASACAEGAWVPTIPSGRATDAEADLYAGVPRAPNVIRALSLVPDAVRQLRELSAAHYLTPREMMDLERGRSIDRRQMELIAGRVSALRECYY